MSDPRGGEISKAFIYTLMIGMVLTGAANTIVFKFQDETTVLDKPYNHPFVQAFTMFFGEFLCLLVFFGRKFFVKNYDEVEAIALAEAEQKGLSTNVSKFWLLIPAGCDCLTSVLQLAGLAFVPSSIYQMMRGGVIIITALLSVLFLRRKLYIHHLLGLFLVIVGITLVGLTSVLYSSDDSKSKETAELALFGIVLLIVSLLTNGILFVSEEKLFGKFYLEPLQMVGFEGVWGMLIIGLIFVPIASSIKCSGDACPYGYLEDPILALRQWGESSILLLSVLSGSVVLPCFNFFGVSVTKNISSLARAVLDVTRTLLVWAFDLAIGSEKFYLLQLAGFVTLVLGNFIYNEIIEIPGLNQYTKRNLAKQSMLSASDEGAEQ